MNIVCRLNILLVNHSVASGALGWLFWLNGEVYVYRLYNADQFDLRILALFANVEGILLNGIWKFQSRWRIAAYISSGAALAKPAVEWLIVQSALLQSLVTLLVTLLFLLTRENIHAARDV